MNNNTDKITNKEKNGLQGPVYKVSEKEYGIMEKYGHIYVTDANDEDTWPLNCTDTYNEEGIRIEEDRMNGTVRMIITFDDNGFEKEKKYYNEDGSLKQKYVRIYNFSEKTIDETGYDNTGTRNNRTFKECNDRWDCTKLINYDNDEKITTISNWIFGIENEKNNWNEFIYTDGEGHFKSWCKHTLNKKGDTIEITELNEDGSVLKITSYADTFDADGNKIEPYKRRTDKELYKTTIENDHHNNWIKKITYFCEKPIYIYKRSIQYFGEDNMEDKNAIGFETPFKIFNPIIVETDQQTINKYYYSDYTKDLNYELTDEQAKWLAEKSPGADTFPYLNYYMLKNKELPCQLTYTGSNVEVMSFLKELTTYEEVDIVHTYKINSNNSADRMIRYTLVFREDTAYMIHIAYIQESDAEEYIIPEKMREYNIGDDGQVRTSQIIVLYPSEDFGKVDPHYIMSNIQEYMESNKMEEIPEKPEIFMVEVANESFSLESHYVNDDFEIKELDVNYGFGFEQFHEDLIQRFTHEHKGLVLFHGIPGTGKTYYIRHLLREMALANKIVIYMPPNMVDYLSEPGFMTFLSKTVAHYSSQNHTCVLLIEDAEPLLIARHNEGRVQGITNLLNMSDGLLNDMLKLQIICTFNVELKQLDAALLRPGRLIARKEFKALPELEANILAKRLGVKYHFEEPATLSEIYAKIKNQNTIIHEE